MAVEVKEYGRVEWDKLGERMYETGVDHVVLYQFVNNRYTNGVAWNGVTSITENKSGAEPSPLYADNIKYLVLKSLEEYGITIECYTYPREFEQNNGIMDLAPGVTIGQQTRSTFGISFRTLVGNDTLHEAYGYKLHLVYGCDASPSEESNSTINDSPEAKTLSYEISSTPIVMENGLTTCCVTIDSVSSDKTRLKALEDILYGSEGVPASLPLPDEITELFEAKSIPAKVMVGDPNTAYYGVLPASLQENIVISGQNISGTLLYKEGYEGFSSDSEEQKGNFLVLAMDGYNANKVETMLNGGEAGVYKQVDDGFCVYRITDAASQSVAIRTTTGEGTTTKTYTLRDLVLKGQE